MEEKLERIDKKPLYKEVYDQLRSYIVRNGLRPGDRLPTEHEISESIHVSRNVLREALKALQLIGVIESAPRTGMYICEFSFDHLFENVFYSLITDYTSIINELREIRSVLEVSFFEEAYAQLTDEDFSDLEKITVQMKRKLDSKMNFYDEDKQFHNVIFRKLKNKSLLSLLNSAWIVSADIKKASSYVNRTDEETYIVHKELSDAMKSQDLLKAKNCLLKHFMIPIHITE
jgi:GntR family transcriptional regulator, transcriptional repressor for pyruvate dehydrogenase complex